MISHAQLGDQWPKKPLGEIVEFLDNIRKPVKKNDRASGPYPYYGANGQQGTIDGFIFDEPLVLLAEDGGHFGVAGRTIAYKVSGKCWVNNHAHVLRPLRTVDIGYLCHHLARYDVTPFITGTTRGKLTKGAASRMPILLPPVAEQRRIASILDKADAVRRKRQESIRLTEEFLRSVFLDMFGDPVTNPKGWEVMPLGEAARVNRGRFSPRPRNDPRFYNGDYPFVQTGDIGAAPYYLKSWKQTLNEEGTAVSKSFSKGSVLVAIVGATIGETAVLSFESYCPDSVVGIIPHRPYTGEFIEYCLRFWKQIFRDKAPETARANINLETLKPVPIPIIQGDLIRRFTSMYQKVASLSSAEQDIPYNQFFDSLMQRGFRGDL